MIIVDCKMWDIINSNEIRGTNCTYDNVELKKLITENPDLPLIFCVGEDAHQYEDFYYNYIESRHISCNIGEFLDCEVSWNNYLMFTDRQDFIERLGECLMDMDDSLQNLSDEEFDKIVEYNAKKFEPYWKKAILVTID